MNWYLEALKKYAVFSGRARRKEYWYFILFSVIMIIPLTVIDYVTGTFNAKVGTGLLGAIYMLAIWIPNIAVSVRRLHDTGRSGWWLLIILVPLIGFIVLFVFTVQDSHQGTNQYGPNPKERTRGGTPSNLATVKQDKAELEKNVDRYVSELKGRGIVHVQDFSHSGSIPKAEVKLVEKSLPSDEAVYEKAFNELESEARQVGLWAKVFAEAQGNESLAKANYLQIRSGQLANEHKQAFLKEERQQQEKEKSIAKETRRDGRFIAYDNGTVLDTQKNSMWAAKDNGKDISWAKANSYCKNYRGGGYSDWRIPTHDELAGLYDSSKTNRHGCHITDLIEIANSCIWAEQVRGSATATSVHFLHSNGLRTEISWMFFGVILGFNWVLPVRSGK